MEKQLTFEVKPAMRPLRSVEEAAGLLGISKWTVRSYIKAGKLKPVRIGRRVLLAEDELERFVGVNQEQVGANGNPRRWRCHYPAIVTPGVTKPTRIGLAGL